MAEKKMAVFKKLLVENNGSLQRMVNGLPVSFFVLPEVLDKLKSFQLYPDDVWVVTYPKCGTTWTQQIVKLIRNNGEPDDVLLDHSIPWLEASAIHPEVDIDKLTRPRAYKSHMPYDLCPCGPPNTTPCKYIYVLRNPKDVAVSYYFHNKQFPAYPPEDWDTFWKKYVKGKMDFGDYLDHLLSWWSHRNDENVLFLKYEDMKKDLPATVSQVASFIGADLSSDVIAKIAALAEFSVMKQDDTANRSNFKAANPNAPDFMRKGVVGDWKNYLTQEQSDQMDALCSQQLKGTGLEFDYE